MERVLRPGLDDADYAEMMSANATVEMRKIGARSNSPLPVGTTKKGKLTSPIGVGRKMEFEESNQESTSEVQAVRVDAAGNIIVETATSVYDVLSFASPHRRASLHYLRRGYLDFDDIMPDGFYDGGRKMAFAVNDAGSFHPETSSLNREIIMVNSKLDSGLQRKLEIVQHMLEDVTDMKSRVLMLAQFVSNVLGGIQVYRGGAGEERACKEEIDAWKEKHGDTLILGSLNHGVCRHRAILFKYLADRVGIRSRLVRGDAGGPHVWNIVDIDGKYFVVDVMQDPFQVLPAKSTHVDHYRRQDGGGNVRGTIGGRSIPQNHR